MDMSQQVKDLRNTFLQQLETKGQDGIHPKDLERIKTDDKWLQRFLMHHDNNKEPALEMIWETLKWRNDFKANEISQVARADLLAHGGFFPHGRDKDGCTIFIFKCKKYVKGANPIDDLKRCVVYWFERLEKEDKGNPITVFFDMEGCGLSNMDMEFTKYLIGLFKQYYPYFLNYILIFEMPWVLSAAFKIIKSWLPEKAVQKIKFVSKKDIKEFVPLDQALVCWGGQDNYVFSYVPEEVEVPAVVENASTPAAPVSRKVHFADGSSMPDSPEGNSDKDRDGGALAVEPPNIITFLVEGSELVSKLELQNTDPTAVLSFKLKTTSPEKFRVRPSVGYLTPGAKTSIHVSLLPGFKLGGLSRDKFLLMSTIITSSEMNQDLAQLWKDTSGRKINQHRLKCAQPAESAKNGNAISVGGSQDSEATQTQIMTILSNLNKRSDNLERSLRRSQHYQIVTMFLVVVLGMFVAYMFYTKVDGNLQGNAYCKGVNTPQ